MRRKSGKGVTPGIRRDTCGSVQARQWPNPSYIQRKGQDEGIDRAPRHTLELVIPFRISHPGALTVRPQKKSDGVQHLLS